MADVDLLTDANPTAFAIDGVGVLSHSARGITFEVKLVENGRIVHDVWGVAHSTARDELNLFEVRVGCEDVWPPAFAGLWRGQKVAITIDDSFVQPVGQDPIRPPADGVVDTYGPQMHARSDGGQVWQRYRPRMQVLVVDWSVKSDEYGGVTSWSITFRETR